MMSKNDQKMNMLQASHLRTPFECGKCHADRAFSWNTTYVIIYVHCAYFHRFHRVLFGFSYCCWHCFALILIVNKINWWVNMAHPKNSSDLRQVHGAAGSVLWKTISKPSWAFERFLINIKSFLEEKICSISQQIKEGKNRRNLNVLAKQR